MLIFSCALNPYGNRAIRGAVVQKLQFFDALGVQKAVRSQDGMPKTSTFHHMGWRLSYIRIFWENFTLALSRGEALSIIFAAVKPGKHQGIGGLRRCKPLRQREQSLNR